MKSAEQKAGQVYKDIFFGTSDSESSEDSAYRCRINTERLKTRAVPITRRQAKSQRTIRPPVTMGEPLAKRRRSNNSLEDVLEQSGPEMASDMPSTSSGPRKRLRAAPKMDKMVETPPKEAVLKASRRSEKPVTVPQRAEEQNHEPTVDGDISRMRDAVLLYNYMSLAGGNTLSTSRPVYRPYLKRTLRYFPRRSSQRKSLEDVVKGLQQKANPVEPTLINKEPENSSTSGNGKELQNGTSEESDEISFTLMFYGIRNRNLAGDRQATVDIYITRDLDGKFEDMKHLESRTFTMAVNKDVSSVAVPLNKEYSLKLQKSVSKMNYYLILKVSFSNDTSISSGGRSLRKIPVRQSALHMHSKDLRLTTVTPSVKVDSHELIMFGACLITSVTADGHTLPKTSTRNGIVLLEPEKINVDEKDWMTDSDLVSRMLKLAKKLHMNPFVKAEFVEDEDVIDELDYESKRENKGEKATGHNTDSSAAEEEEEVVPPNLSYIHYEFPERLAYRFNALPNTKCPPLHTAFKKQKFDEVPDDLLQGIPDGDIQSLSLSTVADILVNSGRGKLTSSNNLSDNNTSRPSTKSIFKTLKAKESDVIVLGQRGAAFPQPDTPKVVTRIVHPSKCCFFCKQHFPDLFALLMHLRTGYPRLDFVYRGRLDEKVGCVDVFVNEHFNGEKDTPGFEYPCDVIKKLPTTTPLYIVSRLERAEAKNLVRNLEMFQTPSTKDKRLYSRHLPISFNPITLHPYYEVPLNTTEKKLDQDWRIESMLRRLHEFTDLTDGEKEFMGLWNMFCLNLENRPTGKNNFYAACRRFLKKSSDQLIIHDLEIEWFAHIAYFKDRGFINEDEAYDLIARYDNPAYNPEEDLLHFVCRDRQRRWDEAEERRKRREEAESKRLKESNNSGTVKRHLLPVMSTRTSMKGTIQGSRDSSVVEREESSSVDSSLIGKRHHRHAKEPDYSHYLKEY
uniref:VEFS-Box domain-containing protein n=1 Tax=Steinernema glaseri TaxID=37863 RepID=A0A1I7Y649_9BILA